MKKLSILVIIMLLGLNFVFTTDKLSLPVVDKWYKATINNAAPYRDVILDKIDEINKALESVLAVKDIDKITPDEISAILNDIIDAIPKMEDAHEGLKNILAMRETNINNWEIGNQSFNFVTNTAGAFGSSVTSGITYWQEKTNNYAGNSSEGKFAVTLSFDILAFTNAIYTGISKIVMENMNAKFKNVKDDFNKALVIGEKYKNSKLTFNLISKNNDNENKKKQFFYAISFLLTDERLKNEIKDYLTRTKKYYEDNKDNQSLVRDKNKFVKESEKWNIETLDKNIQKFSDEYKF